MSEGMTSDAGRQLRLKEIIARLHAGSKPAEVKREFAELIRGVSAEEVGAMEQSLIDEGFPVEEIQRLCEVHVEVFESALARGKQADSLEGHPAHSLRQENREAERRLKRLLSAARAWRRGAFFGRLVGASGAAARDGSPRDAAAAALAELAPLELHYARKENQLFPYLERHGFTGPSKVMWGKHDEIRAQRKACEAALRTGPAEFLAAARGLAASVRRMIFMEERILLPNAMKRLSESDWAEIRAGEEAIGFAWIKPGAAYDAGIVLARGAAQSAAKGAALESHNASRAAAATGASEVAAASTAAAAEAAEEAAAVRDAAVALNTGAVPADVLDLALRSLPLDFSIVGEDDRVLYYSDSPERIFPRSPAVIGRAVQNCHPQKSVAVVERILEAFKRGERDDARFWIRMGERLVVIEYRALRDSSGRYRGTLETSQDATGIKALEGERRLLDWEE